MRRRHSNLVTTDHMGMSNHVIDHTKPMPNQFVKIKLAIEEAEEKEIKKKDKINPDQCGCGRVAPRNYPEGHFGWGD